MMDEKGYASGEFYKEAYASFRRLNNE